MDEFERELQWTLQWEGKFIDDVDDPGGATNYGITQKNYDIWRTTNGLKPRSVRDIQQSEVINIYREWYWDAKYAPPLRMVMFDTAVNFGQAGSIYMLQEALGVKADGFVGRITSNALRQSNLKQTARTVIILRKLFRYERCTKNPSQKKFLQGWLNRDNALLKWLDA